MLKSIKRIVVFTGFILISVFVLGQSKLTSPSAKHEGVTDFGDPFFIFCSSYGNTDVGSLQIESPFASNSTFTWEKYDSISNSFVPFAGNIVSDTLKSRINGLGNAAYRVTVESEGNSYTKTAWVLNNWIRVTNAEIPDSTSNCEGFRIMADYDYAPLNIFDTNTGKKQSIRNPNIDFKTEWRALGELVRSYISPTIYDPIASNTPIKYDLTIEDEFKCTASGSVNYISKVPKAVYVADPMSGEAVLEVVFNNNSINYDSAIWFFYKDSYIISKEIEKAPKDPVDSIDFILYDDSPMHRYEMVGEYLVRLVVIKENETGNCYDTLYMQPGNFISVEDTLIEIPNVFTPNGDGINDVFVIKTKSMKKIKIKIMNRWGGLVHYWEYSNITSSDYTEEHSVWDGRIGKRMATPGVYYYVIQYEGRAIDKEDKRGRPVKGTKTGFIHLFRGKN